MSNVLEKDGPEEIVYKGSLIEVVHQRMTDGSKSTTFEWGRRAPGVRVIAIDAQKRILLTQEHRYEHEGTDYRLPGGKVADTLDELHGIIDLTAAATNKAIQEANQEAGISINKLRLIDIVPDGSTFNWDLYYFETTDFQISSQQLEHGEEISTHWLSSAEILELIAKKKIREGRSVYVLMPYLLG